MSYAHPGSIQARVGAALAGIELNTEQQDMAGIKNFTDLLEDYASVYMEPGKDGKTDLDRLEAVTDATPEDRVYDILRARRRLCLRVLREQNIFGYQGTPAIGNADILKQTIGQELEA